MSLVRLLQAVPTPARATVAAVLILAVCAASASAQTGNGLYEPFPDPTVRSRARTYVEDALGTAARPGDLDNGRFLRGLTSTTTAGQASRRSGTGDGFSGLLTWPGAVALLAVGSLAGAVGRGSFRRSGEGMTAAGR